jgi:hypothetical protein
MYDGYERREWMVNEKVAHAVHRAEYVEYDDVAQQLFVWNGSLTVNVYELTGVCVDMWTLGLTGDEPRDVKRQEAIESIRSRIEGKEAGDGDE